jgi:tRNA(Ile2) C34 agmatinyltransferase TiaS
MLVKPRCQKCNAEGIPFDSKNPVNHFCQKCGELINADDVLQRMKKRIEESMRKAQGV